MSVPGYYYPNQAYPSQPLGPTPALGTDSGLLVESVALKITISSTDTATAGEARSGTLSAIRSDTAAHNDTSSMFAAQSSNDFSLLLTETSFVFEGFLKEVSDSGTFSETRSILVTQSRTDTASGLDTQQESTSFYKADLYTANDQSAMNIVVSDFYNIGTEAASIYVSLFKQDAFTIIDLGFSNRPVDSADLAVLYEQSYINHIEVQTEDPFTYPTYQHSNDLRIIAQDHFTREIIHWDLPVDNVTMTFSLSGPNLFSAKITSEMEQITTLNPPLTPDRTWLHVEENQEIIASFIMTPIIDNPAEQTRTIEGEGFSAYPHWVIYEGNSYTGIRVDPSVMIQKIWNHVQSFEDGNVRVKLTGIGTPVRIGFPQSTQTFTSYTGTEVSLNNEGPYTLNVWSAINCGEEIEKLCKETPIEYLESSDWNLTHSDVSHAVNFGYPRVGRRRDDLIFREGENLYQLIPSYQESQENYASDIFVIGAGTGSASIRAKKSSRIGRLRRTKVIQNQNITRQFQANQLAEFELRRLARSRFFIESITVDATHLNAPFGSFSCGDDIYVQCNVPYIGFVQVWYRIMSYQYDIYSKTVIMQLEPSDSFSYGADKVDPLSYMPYRGYALASRYTVLKADLAAQNPNGFEVIDNADVVDDRLEVLKNDAIIQLAFQYDSQGIDFNTVLGYKVVDAFVNKVQLQLENLDDPDFVPVIGKTSEGGLFFGEGVFFVDNEGNTYGERPPKTKEFGGTAAPIVIPAVAAQAQAVLNKWKENPKLLDESLHFVGSTATPGLRWNIARIYYGWGGTYSPLGPGPEIQSIMRGLVVGSIFVS